VPPIACFAQKYVSQIILGLAYLRCTHLLNFTRSTHMHTMAVSALSKLKQISSISPKMSYQLVDLDSPCQFTCCNVQILHLYTNYIYFPILPYSHRTLDCHGSLGPLSCLLNNKHELAHTASSDLLILDTGHLCTFCVCKVASTTPSFCICEFRLACLVLKLVWQMRYCRS
jgi:hypothetical protein